MNTGGTNCPNCAYPLNASMTSCPECGTAVDVPAATLEAAILRRRAPWVFVVTAPAAIWVCFRQLVYPTLPAWIYIDPNAPGLEAILLSTLTVAALVSIIVLIWPAFDKGRRTALQISVALLGVCFAGDQVGVILRSANLGAMFENETFRVMALLSLAAGWAGLVGLFFLTYAGLSASSNATEQRLLRAARVLVVIGATFWVIRVIQQYAEEAANRRNMAFAQSPTGFEGWWTGNHAHMALERCLLISTFLAWTSLWIAVLSLALRSPPRVAPR